MSDTADPVNSHGSVGVDAKAENAVLIGTGIAGNAAAWALSKRYTVSVYERELRPGGHSHTVAIDYDGTPLAVDIGFIVYNELNYPDLTALFADLGVETAATSMSFAVSADAGRFEWKGDGTNCVKSLSGLFVQPRNLFSLSYLRMLRDVLKFNTQSVEDYAAGRLAGLTLGEYFADRKFAPRLLSDYLAPMGAAIWSAPPPGCWTSLPRISSPSSTTTACCNTIARSGVRSRAAARRYVEKLTSAFRDQIRLGCAATSIQRTPQGVVVNDNHGDSESYDNVVIATHSDQALAMLSDADNRERAILGAVGYATNTIYLHRDTRLMPMRRRAWASWNFLRWQRVGTASNDVAVTYWMNRLQGIDEDKPLFVSLNPSFEPDPALTFGRYTAEHPQYNVAAFAAQKQLGEIQGQRRTWFCGAWTGYGFHEDGLRSGLDVAQMLGANVPWRPAKSSAEPH